MNAIETNLPFRRSYRVDNGCTRRTIEEFPVRLRRLSVTDLAKAARPSEGRLVLEHDGFALHYIGNTRETASLDGLRRHMAAHARYAGGKPYLTRGGNKPRSGIVDDGEAGVLAAVAQAESTYVVVEGCVGFLHRSGGTRIGVRAFRHGRGDASYPWLDFPFARQADAPAVAARLRRHLGGEMPDVRIVDAPTWEILDAAAAERMAVRAEAGQAMGWAQALIGFVRDLAGLLDAAAVIPFLALRDATGAGATDAELRPLLHEAARTLSTVRMPDGIEAGAWWPMRLAAIGLSCRLAAMTEAEAS